MRILYVGVHEVLEYDDMVMFTELDGLLPVESRLNIEIYSLGGAYRNPLQSGGFMRSVIPKGRFYPNLFGIDLQCDKDDIHPELLEWCDVVLFTHNSALPGQKEQQRWVVRNWPLIEKMKKRAIWRSIGQSTPAIEEELNRYRPKGLKLVRYSPLERAIPGFAGEDALIRFYKDEDDFKGWTGETKQVITLAQSFKKRGDHLGFHLFEKITEGMRRKVFGRENEDLVDLNGGSPSYSELRGELRQARVFFYFGTIPAPYTLSIMEAMMTGTPIVAVGPELRKHDAYRWPQYEIPDIIVNGVNGYWSNNIQELRGYIDLLMKDDELAKRIGAAGRETAIKLFGKKGRMMEWIDFLRIL